MNSPRRKKKMEEIDASALCYDEIDVIISFMPHENAMYINRHYFKARINSMHAKDITSRLVRLNGRGIFCDMVSEHLADDRLQYCACNSSVFGKNLTTYLDLLYKFGEVTINSIPNDVDRAVARNILDHCDEFTPEAYVDLLKKSLVDNKQRPHTFIESVCDKYPEYKTFRFDVKDFDHVYERQYRHMAYDYDKTNKFTRVNDIAYIGRVLFRINSIDGIAKICGDMLKLIECDEIDNKYHEKFALELKMSVVDIYKKIKEINMINATCKYVRED